VLLNKQKKPVASRVLGPVAKEIRTQQFMKVGMLASGIL
jgi:ribosomal protein L14